MPHTRENLSQLLMKYATQSNAFDAFSSQYPEVPDSPTHEDVEKQMDDAVKMLEAALMLQSKEALVDLIFAFMSTIIDVTTPEGQQQFLKVLKHFNSYEAFDTPEVP